MSLVDASSVRWLLQAAVSGRCCCCWSLLLLPLNDSVGSSDDAVASWVATVGSWDGAATVIGDCCSVVRRPGCCSLLLLSCCYFLLFVN